jgi:hypothetical protein
MIKLLRRLFGRSQNASSDTQPAWAPRQFVYVMIPGDIQPLVRGQRFEDPLEELLQAAGLGSVSGGGSQLDDPYPDGRPRVAYCGIDIDVVDRDRALVAIRQKLGELGAPAGTEVHYTEGATRLLDRLVDGTWHERLPRSFKHPGFGV